MAYTDIDKPSDYFNTKLYTGNGTSQSITGVNFKPDLVWLKPRSTAGNHGLYDIIRGASLRLKSNSADAESSVPLTSFDSDGFTLSTDYNNSGTTFASWNWLAGGTGASNTDGSITSTVSANTTSGFSIVSYTGTGSNATIGHSLNTTPSMIILKSRDTAENWWCYNKNLGATKYIRFNLSNASGTSSLIWNDTEPTTNVFSVGTDTGVNGSSTNYIAYCFAEKKGFSKFGSYTGNGNADGSYIWTGMKPSFVIIKRTDSADDWYLYDNKRDTINPQAVALNVISSGSEFTTSNILDFVSNGFKLRSSEVTINASGGSYIYMAFAESPFTTSTGISTTAR